MGTKKVEELGNLLLKEKLVELNIYDSITLFENQFDSLSQEDKNILTQLKHGWITLKKAYSIWLSEKVNLSFLKDFIFKIDGVGHLWKINYSLQLKIRSDNYNDILIPQTEATYWMFSEHYIVGILSGERLSKVYFIDFRQVKNLLVQNQRKEIPLSILGPSGVLDLNYKIRGKEISFIRLSPFSKLVIKTIDCLPPETKLDYRTKGYFFNSLEDKVIKKETFLNKKFILNKISASSNRRVKLDTNREGCNGIFTFSFPSIYLNKDINTKDWFTLYFRWSDLQLNKVI